MAIQHVFIFGVVLPTVITILVFILFLVCWFKCNMKEKLLNLPFWKKTPKQPNTVTGPHLDQNGTLGTLPNGGSPGRGVGSGGPTTIITQKPPRGRSSHDADADNSSIEDSESSLWRHCYTNPTMNIATVQGLSDLSPVHHQQHHVHPTNLTWGSPNQSNNSSINSLTNCDQAPLVQQTFHFSAQDCCKMRDSPNVDSDQGSDEANYAHFMPVSLLEEGRGRTPTVHKLPSPHHRPLPSHMQAYNHHTCRQYEDRGCVDINGIRMSVSTIEGKLMTGV